ncbi:MAG: MoxR family ATPase [Candidatus Altiarchaeota archaeon]|nr:MoxR family ATPase [Candidatus Altiarchaeota archaeon]
MTEADTYAQSKALYDRLLKSMEKVIIGQKEVIEQILVAILTGNHALLEGYPGLGKTMMIRALSEVLDLDFSRIQCTPDLMPSDITGTYVIEEEAHSGKKTFRFQEGPIFANIVLADEINRATPKTQSALLESMQEKQVTVGNKTFQLDLPFFILATQNPIEMEGTYPLPEAQLDRFLLKLIVEYPSFEEEDEILDLYTGEKVPKPEKVLDRVRILEFGVLVRKMPIADDIRQYALKLINATRPTDENKIASEFLEYGASTRAGIGLVLAAKARALLRGNNYVSKKDVDAMALPVLRHRLILNFESEREGVTTDEVVKKLLGEVK